MTTLDEQMEQMEQADSVTQCLGCGEQQPHSAYFCEKCGDPLFLGKEAGVYKIVERIGEGGMGVVYKAEHVRLGTFFALKVLHKHFSRKKDLLTRFHNEAKATSKLRHEHIVFITDFGEFEKMGPYIAMEYLEGETLKEAMEPGDPLPLQRALRIGIQIADAMAYAHEESIIHRDLKPDNVLLVRRGSSQEDLAKVLDFGIAKVLESDGDAGLTKTGAVLGTPIYMSPEQALSKELDQRSDVYSFGVILFEMLTGYIPFQGETAIELIEKRLFSEAPKLSTFAPHWSGSPIEALVAHCLERDPKARDLRMVDVKRGLQEFEEAQRAKVMLNGAASSTSSKNAASVGGTTIDWGVSEDLPKQEETVPPQAKAKKARATSGSQPLPTGFGVGAPEFSEAASLPGGAGQIGDPALTAMVASQTPRGLLWVLVILFFGASIAVAAWQPWKGRSTPSGTAKRTSAKRAKLPPRRRAIEQAVPTRIGVLPAKRLVKAGPRRMVVRPRPRHVRRRVRRVIPRRRIAARRRVIPRRRVVPVKRPPVGNHSLGANGCPQRTEAVNFIRLLANDNRVKVASARRAGGWGGRRLPHAKGGRGWCIRVPRGGVHVRIFGGHRELADCWFRLLYTHRPTVSVTLRNLEDGGPGKYCQPR